VVEVNEGDHGAAPSSSSPKWTEAISVNTTTEIELSDTFGAEGSKHLEVSYGDNDQIFSGLVLVVGLCGLKTTLTPWATHVGGERRVGVRVQLGVKSLGALQDAT